MRSRVLPVLAVLLAILIFFGYTKPTYDGSVAASKAAIAADDQALAAAADYQQRASELASEQAAMDPDSLARLEALLPDSVDNVGVILDLDSLAARTGVSLASADAVPETDTSGSNTGVSQNPVASVDLSLSGKGTYSSFKSFLTGIESSERLLDVTNLSVTGSDTGVYSYQMNARLYWLR